MPNLIDQLSENVSAETRSVITTVVDSLLRNADLKEAKSSAESENYDSLSSAQKSKLHKAIKQSSALSSVTIQGDEAVRNKKQSSTEAQAQLDKAYELMQHLAEAKVPLSIEILEELHIIVFPRVQAFRIRTTGTNLATSETNGLFMSPNDLRAVLDNLMVFINSPPPELDWLTVTSIVQGIFISAHPFLDGNGRTNRLLVTYMSILHGKIPEIFVDPEQVFLHSVYSKISPRGLKKEMANRILSFQERLISGIGPDSISPECMQQFIASGVATADSLVWTGDDGYVRTYEDLRIERAKRILTNAKSNQQQTLQVITQNMPETPSSTSQETVTNPKTKLLEYLLKNSPPFDRIPGSNSKTTLMAELIEQGTVLSSNFLATLISNKLNEAIRLFSQEEYSPENVEKFSNNIDQMNFYSKAPSGMMPLPAIPPKSFMI